MPHPTSSHHSTSHTTSSHRIAPLSTPLYRFVITIVLHSIYLRNILVEELSNSCGLYLYWCHWWLIRHLVDRWPWPLTDGISHQKSHRLQRETLARENLGKFSKWLHQFLFLHEFFHMQAFSSFSIENVDPSLLQTELLKELLDPNGTLSNAITN